MIGSSGHARVVLDALERSGRHAVIGLIDPLRRPGEIESGYPVLGTEDDLPALAAAKGIDACVVAIGDNWQRHLVVQRVRGRLPGMAFATVIHPSAQIGRGVEIGQGAVLMAGAIVNAAARIHAFCIVNTAAALDHDSVMEEFSSLAPGARTGGTVRIGAFAAVGIGATVSHGRTVGAHSILGAGAVVVHDIPERSVAYGVPARPVRGRAVGESYL